MTKRCRTRKEITEDLLDRAIPFGECLNCHLAPSVDRGGRSRQYVSFGGRNGQRIGAPKFVYETLKGSVGNLWVLHTCDNSECINIEHLFLGTAQDNTDDMIAKGRKIDDLGVGLRRRISTATRIFNATWRGLSDEEICNRLLISKSTLWNYRGGGGSVFLFAGD